MPNTENINAMIEAILAEDKRNSRNPIFMSDFVHRNNECGTSACIAGWANLLRLKAKGQGAYVNGLASEEGAMEFMGIDKEQAQALFYELDADYLVGDHSVRAAVRVLENLRDHNIANWQLAVIETDQDHPAQ